MPVARVRALAVLAGGAFGALARAGAGRALPARPGEWPWATFAVNLLGSLILAWLTTRLTEMVAPTRYVRLLLGTGFCGALTTFSTLALELQDAFGDERPRDAVVNVLLSLGLGVGAAWLGWVLVS
jgi:fluoride exporter